MAKIKKNSKKKVAVSSSKSKSVVAKKKVVNLVKKIVKRSGRTVPFDQKKIAVAVERAFLVTGEGSKADAKRVVQGCAVIE